MPNWAEEFQARIGKKNFDNLIEVIIVGWAIMSIVVEVRLYIFVHFLSLQNFCFLVMRCCFVASELCCQWKEHQHLMWSAYKQSYFIATSIVLLWLNTWSNADTRLHWLAVLFINIFFFKFDCAMLNWYFIYKLCLTLPMADLNIRMSVVRLSSV